MQEQQLPPMTSGGRMHDLDENCWCRPSQRVVVVHHAETAERPSPSPRPLVVRTPPKRSRWGRPWGKR